MALQFDLGFSGAYDHPVQYDPVQEIAPGTPGTGTFVRDCTKFGFVQDDASGEEIFSLPGCFKAFGYDCAFPPVGTRCRFELLPDKTGKIRAQNVRPEDQVVPLDAPQPAFPFPVVQGGSVGSVGSPVVQGGNPQRQPTQELSALMAIPQSSTPGQPTFTAEGALDLTPFLNSVAQMQQQLQQPGLQNAVWQQGLQHSGLQHGGSFLRDCTRYGFIQDDSTGEEIFVLPGNFKAFGFDCAFPPIGTRCLYDLSPDPKTGRNRAHNVQPEESAYPGYEPMRSAPSGLSNVGPYGVTQFQAAAMVAAQPMLFQNVLAGAQAQPWLAAPPPSDVMGPMSSSSGLHAGTFIRDRTKFGFIQDDAGGEEIFVLPGNFKAFGFDCNFPPVGTRCVYDLAPDKTGKIRAQNVRPEDDNSGYVPLQVQQYGLSSASPKPPSASAPSEAHLAGTIKNLGPKFGFIDQDTGGEPMFFLPYSCAYWNNVMPPVGTRVLYRVVLDGKTGKPRAEDLFPITQESLI